MPVPTLISQLSTTASLNSPDGAVDVPSSIDDYQRAHAAFIAQLYASTVKSVDMQNQTVTAFTTGGTSTAFTLTPTPASAANTANQRFRVKFNAAAGTTPTLAVSGLTALNLKYKDSTGTKQAITATQVPINWVSDVENDGTDWVVLDVPPSAAASESVAGLLEIATAAEAQAFTANKAIDGAKLAAALQGGNQSLATNGYQKLPGGLIIQWGRAGTTALATETVTLPITFPTGYLNAYATDEGTSGTLAHRVNNSLCTTSTISVTKGTGASTDAFNYIVIGY